jgi:mono/diheme cytochrome c family protein
MTVAALLAVSCAGGGKASTPVRASLTGAAVSLGQSIYEQNCATCHGINGEGQPNWRERLPNGQLPPPPHNGSGHTWHHGDGQLYDIVRNGFAGMPAWGDKLSHDEILAVLTYIKTFWDDRERVYQEAQSEADPFPTSVPP